MSCNDRYTGTDFGPMTCGLPKGHSGNHAEDNRPYAIEWKPSKVVPHPPIHQVRGYDTNEMEANEYRNG